MFRRTTAATVVAALQLAACTSSSTLPTAPTVTVPMGSDFTLAPNQSAIVNPGDVQLTFGGVTNESRCPTSVQCVQAGSARIALRVVSTTGSRDLAVETRPSSDTASIDGFLVRLVGVAPVPGNFDPIPAASYRATLRVTTK